MPFTLRVGVGCAPLRWQQQRPQASKTVARCPPLGRQFPQRLFNSRRQQSGSLDYLVKKLSPEFQQRVKTPASIRRKFRQLDSPRQFQPMRQMRPEKKRDRAGPNRCRGPIDSRLRRAQPAPTNATRETKLIKPTGGVVVDKQSKQLRVPPSRR